MVSSDPYAASNAASPVFSTGRLRVRRWRANDEAALLDVYGDRNVVRWVDDGEPLSANEAARWMAVTHANYARYGYGMYAIEDMTGASTIGFGGLVHPKKQVDVEVKYAFLPEVWGQGLATEFVRGLLRHARYAHGLTRIIATVAKGNLASQNVLRKCAFCHSHTREEEDGSVTEVLVWEA